MLSIKDCPETLILEDDLLVANPRVLRACHELLGVDFPPGVVPWVDGTHEETQTTQDPQHACVRPDHSGKEPGSSG
jgi:hypothetical protein